MSNTFEETQAMNHADATIAASQDILWTDSARLFELQSHIRRLGLRIRDIREDILTAREELGQLGYDPRARGTEAQGRLLDRIELLLDRLDTLMVCQNGLGHEWTLIWAQQMMLVLAQEIHYDEGCSELQYNGW